MPIRRLVICKNMFYTLITSQNNDWMLFYKVIVPMPLFCLVAINSQFRSFLLKENEEGGRTLVIVFFLVGVGGLSPLAVKKTTVARQIRQKTGSVGVAGAYINRGESSQTQIIALHPPIERLPSRST